MFHQIFFSPQVKRCVVITYKHGTYELPHEMPNADASIPSPKPSIPMQFANMPPPPHPPPPTNAIPLTSSPPHKNNMRKVSHHKTIDSLR